MNQTYSKEQLEKLFDNLPAELQDAIFSMETAKNISFICEGNEVLEKLEEISELAGYVLFGLLKASDFPSSLEKDLGIPKEKAKIISQEINRFIFYPVKPFLDQMNEMKTEENNEKMDVATKKRNYQQETVSEDDTTKIKEETEREETGIPPRSGNDSYRESVE
jgi:hypothetical protein